MEFSKHYKIVKSIIIFLKLGYLNKSFNFIFFYFQSDIPTHTKDKNKYVLSVYVKIDDNLRKAWNNFFIIIMFKQFNIQKMLQTENGLF